VASVIISDVEIPLEDGVPVEHSTDTAETSVVLGK